MKKDVFDHLDYRSYLLTSILARPKKGRGVRMALAHSLKVPVSHISQVLSGVSHLSLEQAEGVNEFLGHTSDEAHFFLLLVQRSRAGTAKLRARFDAQMKDVLSKRLVLKDRLGVKASLSAEDQATFYSSWVYGAVHVMLSIERFQNKEAISHYLGVSLKRTAEVIEFLTSIGLAEKDAGGRLKIGTSRIHLGSDSPMISKFHTNWRMRAIRSMESESFSEDLHYSSAVTIADADVLKIKSMLVKTIEEIKAVIKESKEQGAHCFSLDFFRL